MQIETMDIGGTKVMGLTGEVDMSTSPDLRKALMGIIKHRPLEVVVDFGGVTYIDSSGIATFVEGLKAMRAYNGRLKLASINERIMDIFRFAKLDKVFETYQTVNDALKS